MGGDFGGGSHRSATLGCDVWAVSHPQTAALGVGGAVDISAAASAFRDGSSDDFCASTA